MHNIHSPIRVHILLDQDILYLGVHQILKEQSFIDVTCASRNIEFTTQKVSEKPPHVFITHAQLSSGNAYQIAKDFHQKHETHTLFLTSQPTSENEIHHALEHGVRGIINTQCSSSEFLDAIRTIASHNTYFTDRSIKKLITQTAQKPLLTPRRHRLSPREIEVLKCLGSGLRASQISDELKISVKTVDRHKSNIMTKLGLYSQVQLALYAVREGVTPL